MIIDLLKNKQNIVQVGFYDTISSNLNNNSFTTKSTTDLLSWTIQRNIASTTFTIISNGSCKLDSLSFDIIGQYLSLKIETSLDFSNWGELPYKSLNDEIYIFTETVSGVNKYMNIVSNEIIDENPDMVYIYTKYNVNTKKYENLYDNYEFRFLKFTFTQIQADSVNKFYFANLSISIDEDFNDSYMDQSFLNIRSSMLYRPKYFETYDFLPDVIQNFMNMLEINNNGLDKSHYKTVFLQKSNFSIVDLSNFIFIDNNVIGNMIINQNFIVF